MGKNIDKNVSENLNGKYSPKPFHHAKYCATYALKTTSKKSSSKNS